MTDDAATILVVEDDAATRTFLADNLTADGYELLVADYARATRCACSSASTRTSRSSTSGCPTATGSTLVARVRARRRRGHADRPDAAAARAERPRRRARPPARRSSAGADDYIAKPFSYPELRAADRARCCAAPTARTRRGRLRVGALEVDPAAREVALARAAGRALAEGVRAAAHAGRRADARVHQGGAAAHGLGLPLARARRARSTRTPAACGHKLARDGDRFVSTCGASATGSSTARRRTVEPRSA